MHIRAVVPFLFILFIVGAGIPVAAQTAETAVATADTPVFVAPDETRPPIRVAAKGTRFEVVSEEGEWTKVRFRDPRWGPRVGYVATHNLQFHRPALEPMDLSIDAPRPMEQPAPPPVPATEPRPVGATPPPMTPVWQEPETSDWPRSYVIGRGGVTFDTQTAPLAGVEVGGNLTSYLQAYGSFDWHRDVLPREIDDITGLISAIVGTDIDLRAPAYVAMGGLKVIAPRGRVRPYGLGGVGYGRVNGKVEVEGEDVTGLLDELGALDRDDIEFNKLLFEVGGGIAASTGPLYIDIGYRFRKFLDTGEPVNVSGVYAGAGVGF